MQIVMMTCSDASFSLVVAETLSHNSCISRHSLKAPRDNHNSHLGPTVNVINRNHFTKMTSNIRLVKRNHSFLTILSSISWVIFSLNFVALRMMFANILLQYAKMEAKTQFNKNEGKGERLICSQLRSKNDRKSSRIRGDNLSDHQQSKLSP
jgi:hypothetical protein